MIDKRELRIGNKIRYSDHELTVEYLPHTTYVQTEENINGYLDQYDGIDLTPEILERCDFELITWNGAIKQYYKSITENNNCTLSFVFGEYKDYPNRLDAVKIGAPPDASGSNYGKFKIKYLHQLQNLYFALTGVELEIKK